MCILKFPSRSFVLPPPICSHSNKKTIRPEALTAFWICICLLQAATSTPTSWAFWVVFPGPCWWPERASCTPTRQPPPWSTSSSSCSPSGEWLHFSVVTNESLWRCLFFVLGGRGVFINLLVMCSCSQGMAQPSSAKAAGRLQPQPSSVGPKGNWTKIIIIDNV